MEKLNALSDEAAQESVDVERSFLKQIGGNCHLPVAAYCDKTDKGTFRLRAMFGTEDGSRLAFTDITDDDTEKNSRKSRRRNQEAAGKIIWEKLYLLGAGPGDEGLLTLKEKIHKRGRLSCV